MFHNIHDFITDNTKNKSVLKRTHKYKTEQEFYLYSGSKMSDNIFDTNITKDDFVRILTKINDTHGLHNSQFYTDKVYYQNNKEFNQRNMQVNVINIYKSVVKYINNDKILLTHRTFYKNNIRSVPRRNYNYIENREVIEISIGTLTIYLVYVLTSNAFYIYVKFDKTSIQDAIDFYTAFLI